MLWSSNGIVTFIRIVHDAFVVILSMRCGRSVGKGRERAFLADSQQAW